jgi:hypothetical protein
MPARFLIYLVVVVFYQSSINVALMLGWKTAFYFDTRISYGMLGPDHIVMSLRWLGVALHVIAIGTMIRYPGTVLLYLVFEAILASLNIFFFGLVIFSALSAHHGFSIGELLIPLPVFAFATVIPWVWGFRLYSEG